MNFSHRTWAIVALATAGTLWGLTVPLSKVGLEWLGPSWLAVARFAIAAPLLALLARRQLHGALTPAVAPRRARRTARVILLQSAGIDRTNVAHAALDRRRRAGARRRDRGGLRARERRRAQPRPGALVALAGVALVAAAGGAGTLAERRLVGLSVGAGFGRSHHRPARPAAGASARCARRPARRHGLSLPVARDEVCRPRPPTRQIAAVALRWPWPARSPPVAVHLGAGAHARPGSRARSSFWPLVGAGCTASRCSATRRARGLGALAILGAIALPALLDSGSRARRYSAARRRPS